MKVMKGPILKMFGPMLKSTVKAQINSLETRAYLVKLVNEKIDLPELNEAEEAKLVDRLYLALVEAANIAIDRI
jgi:hypothetical protein